ncbi:MAG: sugar phosphate isomerase/epimerase family protein [Tepidisphaeraceae bacterium]
MAKITFSTLATPAWTFDQIFDRAHAFGYTGVDLRGSSEGIDATTSSAFTSDLAKTKGKLDTLGIAVPCVCSSVVLNMPDPAKWNAMLDEYARCLALANALGSPFIRIFPGPTPKGFTPEQTVALAQRHVRQLLKITGDRRVRPAYETHDDWNTAARALQILDGTDVDEFPVLWDVRHTWRAGEPLEESLRLFGKRVKHTHFKDDRRTADGKLEPTLIGQGEVPVANAIALLRAAGYDGWYCLENEKRWLAAAPEPETILPQWHAFASECLR